MRFTEIDMRAKRNKQTMDTLRPAALLCALALAAGCGGSSKTSTTAPIISNPTGTASMPTPPAPAASNTYTGTQGPGVWTVALNDTAGTFSYQPVTYPSTPNTPTTGGFTTSSGFLNLGTANGAALGYALEIPGRMVMLRPGGTTAPLVVGVPQTSCYSIPYRLRYDYVGMDSGSANGGTTNANGSKPIYPNGSFVVDTTSNGADWQFQNLQSNTAVSPSTFTGTCAAANAQTAITLSGEGVFNSYNEGNNLVASSGSISTYLSSFNIATMFTMGPTGIFIVDQSSPTSIVGNSTGSAVAGVAQPQASLTTSAVAAASYLGFLTQDGYPNGTPPVPVLTSPVSFGQTASSGTTLNGGDYPNDDVTQTPNSDISITLGSQDSAVFGLYASASVTVLDPAQVCAGDITSGGGEPVTAGFNAQGFATCTFPATAVVGNPEGKYAIFLNANNYAIGTKGSEIAPMQIYLYQQ